MNATFTGGCLCGAVRYEIAAEPAFAVHCQCRDCQHMTGTGHASAMLFPLDSAKVTGEAKFHTVRSDRGNNISRGFCPDCGAMMFFKLDANPAMLGVTPGTLDDPSRFEAKAVFYACRAQPWDKLDPALPSFEKMPPG